MVEYKILVQARMSSVRLPGKVLKPFGDSTVLGHLISRLNDAVECHRLIVVTSNHHSDDPIKLYCEKNNIKCFRGDLNDVYLRFVSALEQIECDYFFRVCGDSPLFPIELINFYLTLHRRFPTCDIISNTVERTFPKGYSLELVKTETFKEKYSANLDDALKEHVTPLLYQTFHKMVSVTTTQKFKKHYAVDTINDYKNLSSDSHVEKINFDRIKEEINYY